MDALDGYSSKWQMRFNAEKLKLMHVGDGVTNQ